jgi:hypothetical protein
MELYPWSFDSIHSHCHDDVNSFSFNFEEFWAIARYRAPPGHVIEKVGSGGNTPINVFHFRLVPASCDFYMEIYNWDGQTR